MAAGTSLGIVGALTFAVPAQAAPGGAVVVRGTTFPVGAGLAHVGCTSIYDNGGSSAQPFVAQGPGTAPLGARSLGFDLAGGDAAGPVRYTSSMAETTTASVAAYAAQGTSGMAWVGYQEPGQESSGLVWFGRAPLSVPAGAWTTVQAASLTYDWAQYDTETGRVVAAGPAQGVADFAAAHGGTGSGLWALTLGCDGRPFHVDAFTVGDGSGTTTYDLEGLSTELSISGSTRLVAGESMDIGGTLTASGGATVAHATAILESRTSGGWQPVGVADAAGGLGVRDDPRQRTEYRWRFVDRPLAEASTSPVLVVEVAREVSADVGDDGRRVAGTVSSGRPGLEVTLRPAEGNGPARTATTGPGGEFSVTVGDLPTGSYVATVAASDVNLAGRSAPVRVVTDPSAPDPEAPAQPQAPETPEVPETAQPTPQPPTKPSPEPTRRPDDSAPTSPAPTAPAPTSPAPSSSPTPDAPSSQAPSAPPRTEPGATESAAAAPL